MGFFHILCYDEKERDMNFLQSRKSRRETLKLMALTMAGTGLAACQMAAPSAPAATQAPEELAPATTGMIRLQLETGPGKDFEQVIEAFNVDVPGIEVEFTQVDPATAGIQWHRIAIESGLTDLLSNENPKFLFLDPLLKAGMLMPLDQYAELYEWDKTVLAEALKRSSRSGQLWSLPLYYELCGVAYRKSTLEQVGAEVPQTWEEFLALLEKFQAEGMIPLTVGHRGFSQIQMLHYQLWASTGGVSGPGSIVDVIFGEGKFTDAPCIEAANGIIELYDQGLLDKDCLSITQDDAAERFLGGEAALHVTGTWFYSEMARTFGDDWDMFTAPGPGGAPVWCTGETEAMVIPHNSKDPDAAGRFLDYCVSDNGAKILREQGNVLSTKAFSELAIPQVQHLPVVTGEESSLLIFGWMPQESQDAYQLGLGGILDRSVAVEQWAADVQKAWEQNIADGKVPADRSTLL
jgi:raffinose/stachyose/melibiose transport system substrate-binding protein